MSRTCDDVEPYVEGVKQDITYGFGGDVYWDFKADDTDLSVCRQLFASLYYKRFKESVRVDVQDGSVHLTVPSYLSIGEPEQSPARVVVGDAASDTEESVASVEYGNVPAPPADELKDEQDDRDEGDDDDAESVASVEQGVVPALVQEFEDIAFALIQRVPRFSVNLQFENLSTTVVLLGACHGILETSPGIDVRAYWSKFERIADDGDKRLYMASLNLAQLPIPPDFMQQYEEVPFVYANTFERLVEDMGRLPKTADGWRELSDTWTVDWLNRYATDKALGNSDMTDFYIGPCIAFLSRADVQKAMAAKLTYRNAPQRIPLVSEIGRQRIYFLTHAVYTMTAYGRTPWLLNHGLDHVDEGEELYRAVLSWLRAWHDQLTAKPAMVLRECEIVSEIGSCILIMCSFLQETVPEAVIRVADGALRRKADCPIAKPGKTCAFAFHQPRADAAFEDYHTSLVLAHQACLLSRFFADS